MSSSVPCECPGKRDDRMANWEVTKYQYNNSVFASGGYETSAYSTVRCTKCLGIWRTKANYVEELME